MISDIRNN